MGCRIGSIRGRRRVGAPFGSGRETPAGGVTGNGRSVSLDVEPDTPLLYVLRNDLGLDGPKFGCGLDQCGACTVIMNGRAVRSCVTPMSRAAGTDVVTVEGLGTVEQPHPLQQAFIDE